jgi:Heterokaryon incompatibility protein (HET)
MIVGYGISARIVAWSSLGRPTARGTVGAIAPLTSSHSSPRSLLITELKKSPKVPIKVIDCRSRSIVPYYWGQRYIALSYVWGSGERLTVDEAKQLESSKVLPAQIPRTIEDALQAVKCLRERLLWVDLYCIGQYHAEGKQEQIGAMGDVYGCALLTLVALGDNADAGIDGIRSARTYYQPSVSVGSRNLVWAMRGLQQCLESSRWSTRAWTYQEALLSPRCLIVTQYQLFFVCGLETVCKAFPNLGSVRVRSMCPWHHNPINPIMLKPSDSVKLSRYEKYAEAPFERRSQEYRKRHLSYETDALNAFRGVLAKSETRTYWGVPLYNCYNIVPIEAASRRRNGPKGTVEYKSRSTPECGFAYGLLWRVGRGLNFNGSDGVRQRRPGLPSWTWASTANNVTFVPAVDTQRSYDHLLRGPAELWCQANNIMTYAQIRLANGHAHALQNFNDVAALCSDSTIAEHGQRLSLTSYVAPCKCKYESTAEFLCDKAFQWSVDAPFLPSCDISLEYIDPEGYEEIRPSDSNFSSDWEAEWESEAILMVGTANKIWWMVIGRKSDVYVRIGILETRPARDDWFGEISSLERKAIELC